MTFQCRSALVTLAGDEALIHFYTNLLSQTPARHIPGIYAEFQLPGLHLGIFQPKVDHRPEFAHQAKTGMSICLEVDNLVGAIAHLTTLGYPPPGEIIVASHGREIYAYDPAGNRLILHQTG
ncbi:MAG: VOC family protein [Cyanothece sp. SIO1E1]|nr:VOC family protein [Cyanothece sp. SIO1E1]